MLIMFVILVRFFKYDTMVGNYINIMKTTFDFFFDLYQALNNTMVSKNINKKEKFLINKASLYCFETFNSNQTIKT